MWNNCKRYALCMCAPPTFSVECVCAWHVKWFVSHKWVPSVSTDTCLWWWEVLIWDGENVDLVCFLKVTRKLTLFSLTVHYVPLVIK